MEGRSIYACEIKYIELCKAIDLVEQGSFYILIDNISK